MSVTFRPAKRENVPLLLGVAGGTGSGKTYSALRLARGIADGKPFAGIDTENRRMNHYADQFPELHVGQIAAPFRPEKYAEAIEAGVAYLVAQGVPAEHRVVVVDSMSHEWAGDGGCLDWHDEIMGGDLKKSPVAWAKVKPAHKKMVGRLLQVGAHVVVCLRAEPKLDITRENGEVKFVPKMSLTGLDGWMPITEKNFPFELTASFLLMAEQPGLPRPIKLEDQHKPLVPLDKPLDEQVGRALAEWAAGTNARTTTARPGAPVAADEDIPTLTARLLELAARLGKEDTTQDAITQNRASRGDDAHRAYLRGQITRAETKLADQGEPQSEFAIPTGATSGEPGS